MRNEDKITDTHNALICPMSQLTWLTVLLICGLGLYLRLGLWDQ